MMMFSGQDKLLNYIKFRKVLGFSIKVFVVLRPVVVIAETVSNNASKNSKPEAITGQVDTTGEKKNAPDGDHGLIGLHAFGRLKPHQTGTQQQYAGDHNQMVNADEKISE